MKIEEITGARRFEIELSIIEIDILYRALHDYTVIDQTRCGRRNGAHIDLATAMRKKFNAIR